MPGTILEKVNSRDETVGVESPSAELLYAVYDAVDEDEVHTLVRGTIPAFYNSKPYQSYSISTQGGSIWDVVVRYGAVDPLAPTFRFDTTGARQKITQSRKTKGSLGLPGQPPPDFKGAIGVGKDTVEGTEVPVPVYNFEETHKIPVADITEAYKRTLFNLTGKVNDAPYKGFDIGECLFLGAVGGVDSPDYGTLNYKFAGSPNVIGVLVGELGEDVPKLAGEVFTRGDFVWEDNGGNAVADNGGGAYELLGRAVLPAVGADTTVRVSGLEKAGWDYLWVRYQDDVDTTANTLIKIPVAAYVEEVSEYADLSQIGIGS